MAEEKKYKVGDKLPGCIISKELKSSYPDIPWSMVAGLRHRLVHDYDGIKDTCQMVMTGFVAPSSVSTAENLSKMLGNETVMTGSVTRGPNTTTTSSMIGRPLESPSDLTTMPMGTYIIMKGGVKPIKTSCRHYSEFLPIQPDDRQQPDRLKVKEIHVATAASLQTAAKRRPIILYRGMFDL